MLLVSAAPALAQGFSYNFIEGQYQRVDLDDGFFNVDGDGFGLGGSVELSESWFMFGGYNSTSFDFGVDLDQLGIGGGWHTPLSPTMDFVASLAYVRLDVGNSFGSFDDDGIAASIGVRTMISSNVELAGAIEYVELSDSGNDTSLNGSLLYNFTPNFAAGLNVGAGDDIVTYGVGARFYFGN